MMVASTRKGLTACTVSTIPDAMGLFVTINICTVMTASHDVSVALLDHFVEARKPAGSNLSRQDKTRSRTFFQQTFRDTHTRDGAIRCRRTTKIAQQNPIGGIPESGGEAGTRGTAK